MNAKRLYSIFATAIMGGFTALPLTDITAIAQPFQPYWEKVPGCAKAISVSTSTAAWVLGCASGGAGGYQIFVGGSGGWTLVPGAATSISVQSTHPAGSFVGPDIPWVVSADGKIFRRLNNAWYQISGCAKDIAVGYNDNAWVLGCASGGTGGYQIFSWNGSGWTLMPGAATKIAIRQQGHPWVVASNGGIYKWVTQEPPK